MSNQEIFRTKFPYHLARMYEITSLEIEPRLRVMRLIELYEHTLRYLALVGLAEYLYRDLFADYVVTCRRDLNRPSLGHWLALIKAVDQALTEAGFFLHTPPLNMIFRDGPIYDAGFVLASLAQIELPRKFRLSHFLDLLVGFRNKKIGHGSMSYGEASNIVGVLETALSDWLAGQSVLQKRQLIYIDQVEWTGKDYSYIGHDLNHGTSIFPFFLRGNSPVTPRQVYLREENDQMETNLFTLDPFLEYNKDYTLIYVFNEISNGGSPILSCPYASSIESFNLKTGIDPMLIVGDYIISQDIGVTG